MSVVELEGVGKVFASKIGPDPLNGDVIYINEADPEQWRAAQSLKNGFEVANAPRPLIGIDTWLGPFREGVFYAAGHTEHWDGLFGWRADHAKEVVMVSNAEIEEWLQERVFKVGRAMNPPLDFEGVTLAESAKMYGLPWHEGTRAERVYGKED